MSPELLEYLRNYIYLTKKVYETTNETKHLEGDGQKPDAKFVSYGDRALDLSLIHISEPTRPY